MDSVSATIQEQPSLPGVLQRLPGSGWPLELMERPFPDLQGWEILSSPAQGTSQEIGQSEFSLGKEELLLKSFPRCGWLLKVSRQRNQLVSSRVNSESTCR